MSSHREAPEIAKDPVADNTDLYAFVSPDKPTTVTIVANYFPMQEPAGGPNFYQFGDDVLYEISIDNDADGMEEITYQFRFTTQLQNPNTFLYNTGPIASLTDQNWNLRQVYSVTRVDGDRDTGTVTPLATAVPCPPVNIGPRSTPTYAALADAAVTTLPSGETVFAGQRADPFYVDLGSIFDLAALRPFENLHLLPTPKANGVNGLMGYNVHSIVLQLPKTMLTADGANPSDVMAQNAVIGVWATARRQLAQVRDTQSGQLHQSGPWTQVSRLGNPLINEVIIPLGQKDGWNAAAPVNDATYLSSYQTPELAGLLPVLYPNVFPNLAALNAAKAARADLVAILLTGIPGGLIPGFQNFTGTTPADTLRLNLAIPPAASPNPIGLIAGDAAGFPNGRRLADNIVAIELRAVAGVVYPLIDKTFKPDDAAALLTDGTAPDGAYLATFPYVGYPYAGYAHSHDTPNM